MTYRPWIATLWLASLLLACLALHGAPAFAQSSAPATASTPTTPITLHYYERKPFHYSAKNGQPAGLVITPTITVFNKAGIPVTWQLTPANRILATLRANIGNDCSPGWYKSPERASYARYTLPIYREKPLVGLSKADYAAPVGITARELLSRPQTRLLHKQNFVYGAYIDQLVARMPRRQIQTVTDEVPSMVRMLRVGMADLIIVTQEEADLYATESGGNMQELRILNFPDVPAVEQRYILCSKRVPQAVIDRLNAAIGTLPP